MGVDVETEEPAEDLDALLRTAIAQKRLMERKRMANPGDYRRAADQRAGVNVPT